MFPRTAVLALCAAALLAAACGGVKAQAVLPDAGPLAMPDAPARIVVPASPEPPPPPVIDTPTTSVTPPVSPGTIGRPRTDPPPVRPTPAVPPQTSAPPTTPPASPTPLEATPNPSALERQARDLVGSATLTLDRIDAKTLSADGRAQYDIARRFLQQADAALKAKNIVYAWQLADKANTIATLLR